MPRNLISDRLDHAPYPQGSRVAHPTGAAEASSNLPQEAAIPVLGPHAQMRPKLVTELEVEGGGERKLFLLDGGSFDHRVVGRRIEPDRPGNGFPESGFAPSALGIVDANDKPLGLMRARNPPRRHTMTPHELDRRWQARRRIDICPSLRGGLRNRCHERIRKRLALGVLKSASRDRGAQNTRHEAGGPDHMPNSHVVPRLCLRQSPNKSVATAHPPASRRYAGPRSRSPSARSGGYPRRPRR